MTKSNAVLRLCIWLRSSPIVVSILPLDQHPALMTNVALSKDFYNFKLLLDPEFATILGFNLSGIMGKLFKSQLFQCGL
jgi:hypothetical protein